MGMIEAGKVVRLPDGRECQRCQVREATGWFDRSGVAGHGFEQAWCEVCILAEQIPHARARAARLGALEARWEELTGARFPD